MSRIDSLAAMALALAGLACVATACPDGTDVSGDAPASPTDRRGTFFGDDFGHPISVPISNYDSDCNPWLTADETEIFFIRHSGTYGPADAGFEAWGGEWDIYHAEKDTTTGDWGPVTNLGPRINTSEGERRPTTTAEGDTLFFGRGSEIYYSIRTAGDWSDPVAVLTGFDPCLSQDGLHLYYCKYSGANDIYHARRAPSGAIDAWIELGAVPGAVNGATTSEVRPYISRDDTQLFFSDFGGLRSGGFGGVDLWVSDWQGPVSGWSTPVNVGPMLNVDRPACTAYLSLDGDRFYMSSETFEGARGAEDIWVALRGLVPQPDSVGTGPASWELLGNLQNAWNVYRLDVDADGTLYAATYPAAVHRSEDDGATWSVTAAIPGSPRIAYSVLASSDGRLYVGTYPDGDVWVSLNRGDTWLPTGDIAGATAVRALLETSDGRILAGVSPDPAIYELDTSGGPPGVWVLEDDLAAMTSSVTTLYEASDGTLFAGGWRLPYRRLPDGHADCGGGPCDWEVIQPFTGQSSIEAFLEDDAGRMWMCGWSHDDHGGFVAYSDSAGALDSWVMTTPVTAGELTSCRNYALAETPDGDVLVGFQPGPDLVVVRTEDDGSTWNPEGVLDGARDVQHLLRLEDGSILAATTPNGDVFKWTAPIAASPPDSPADPPGVTAVVAAVPNPFRAETAVRFQLAAAGPADVSIVDASGRRVRRLASAVLDPGYHEITWDGEDDRGRSAAPGAYFARLAVRNEVTYQKLVRLP